MISHNVKDCHDIHLNRCTIRERTTDFETLGIGFGDLNWVGTSLIVGDCSRRIEPKSRNFCRDMPRANVCTSSVR